MDHIFTFKLVYVAKKSLASEIIPTFIEHGATVLEEEPHFKSFSLHQQMFIKETGNKNHPNVIIYFYYDCFKLAKDLIQLSPDQIILDERLTSQKSKLHHKNSIPQNTSEAVTPPHSLDDDFEEPEYTSFESLRAALDKFTPQTFYYPIKRVSLVTTLERHEELESKLEPGFENLRHIFIDPLSPIKVLANSLKRLNRFKELNKKTSLVVSGGALEGYIYAVGVSHAFNEAMENKNYNDFDIFCGVSSGAILTSCLAAGLSPKDLVEQLYRRHKTLQPLSLSMIFDFAAGEIVKHFLTSLRSLPSLEIGDLVAKLQSIVPTGLFKGEKLKQFIHDQLIISQSADSMLALKKELYINATDQDSGESVTFGEEPWRDVKISQAVRASIALPPFYLPENIKGHWFTDGQLTQSADFSKAIEKGAGLVIYIDPMVSYKSNMSGAVLKKGGYFTTVQAIKTLAESKVLSFLKYEMDKNPDVDFIIFKPTDKLMEMMSGNPMKYSIREEIAELSYRATLTQLLDNYESYQHILSKHHIKLKEKAKLFKLLHSAL